MSIKNNLSLLFSCIAIFGFAVAQPIYSLLEDNFQYIIDRYTIAQEFFFLIIAVSYVMPCILFLTLLFFKKLKTVWVYNNFSFLIFFALFACWISWIADRVGMKWGMWGYWRLSVIFFGAGILAWIFIRSKKFRFFIAMLSPAAFLFPLVFIFFTPAFKGFINPPKLVAIESTVMHQNDDSPPVIMIVFDEFMLSALVTDTYIIDKKKFPNFSLLAEDSTWFRNATANHHETHQALPILLTGRYPAGEMIAPVYANFPQNIFTFLSNTHNLKIFEHSTLLCPTSLCPQRYDFSYTQKVETTAYRGREFNDLAIEFAIIYANVIAPHRLVDLFGFLRVPTFNSSFESEKIDYMYRVPHENFINHIIKEDGGRPDFYFLHANRLPHRPWRQMASGKFYADYSEFNVIPPGMQAGKWAKDAGLMRTSLQRYLEQIAFTDQWLGNVIQKLKESDIYDRSLIVVTADHGIAFVPGEPTRYITENNFHQVLPIPLFIKKPFQKKGFMSDKNVESVDILPTIADVIGIKVPWQVDGHSMYSNFLRNNKIAFVGEKNNALTFGAEILKKFPTIQEFLRKDVPQEKISKDELYHEINVVIFNQDTLQAVDLKSDFIPTLIVGKIMDGETIPTSCELTIFINGLMQGATKLYELDGQRLFQFFVPEDSFIEGSNTVSIYC